MALGYIRTSPYRHTMNTPRHVPSSPPFWDTSPLLSFLKTISPLLSCHIYAYDLNLETTNEKTCTIGISQTDLIHLNTILLSCIHCHANKQYSCCFMADEKLLGVSIKFSFTYFSFDRHPRMAP